jgi:endoribonuclease Dicer
MQRRALGATRKTAFFVVRSPDELENLSDQIQVNCVTLVFQQFAVLDCNLGIKIDRFCGEMGCDLWSKEIWVKHFSKNMAIVCTAEVLYQCLMHGFISIDQINLLIFDEAHHAKKNHSYAR